MLLGVSFWQAAFAGRCLVLLLPLLLLMVWQPTR